jgi:hypothetical protein
LPVAACGGVTGLLVVGRMARPSKTAMKVSKIASSVKVQVRYKSKNFQKQAPRHLAKSYQKQANELALNAEEANYDLDVFKTLFLEIFSGGSSGTAAARTASSSRTGPATATHAKSTCPLRFKFCKHEFFANVPVAQKAEVKDAQQKLRVQAQKSGWTLATVTLKWRALIYEHGGTVPSAEREGPKRLQMKQAGRKRLRTRKMSPAQHASLFSKLEPSAEVTRKEQAEQEDVPVGDSEDWFLLYGCQSIDEPTYRRLCESRAADVGELDAEFSIDRFESAPPVAAPQGYSYWPIWGPWFGAARVYKIRCRDCDAERTETWIFNGVNVDPWLHLENRMVTKPVYKGKTYQHGNPHCHVSYCAGRPNPWMQPIQTLQDLMLQELTMVQKIPGECGHCGTDVHTPIEGSDGNRCATMYMLSEDICDVDAYHSYVMKDGRYPVSELEVCLQEMQWPKFLKIRLGAYELHGKMDGADHPHGPVVFPWKFGPGNSELWKLNLDKDYYLVRVKLLDDEHTVFERFTYGFQAPSDERLETEHKWEKCKKSTGKWEAVKQSEVYSLHSQAHVVTLEYQRGKGASETIEATSSGAYLFLGEAGSGVPPEVHSAMQFLAKSENIPLSTPEQRRSNYDDRDERITPAAFVAANRYGYIGPALPPPPGFVWYDTWHRRLGATVPRGWILVHDPKSTSTTQTLKLFEKQAAVDDPPWYFSSLLRDQPVDLLVMKPGSLQCEKYDKFAYNKNIKSRYLAASGSYAR